jgi:putative beta-lysine N-acetyltransferase
LPPDYEIRSARSEDIAELADLYANIFETYPTPIDDPQYIKKMMHANTHFKIMLHEGKIVSAASLDIDLATKSAELTDCATLPQYRGLSLMSYLVAHLEKEAINLGLITVYTIARAASTGINAVFFRHGYAYYGRFVNNCEICGKLEDMNLWSKVLTEL